MADRLRKEQNKFVEFWDETNRKDRVLSRRVGRKRLNAKDRRELIEDYKHDVFKEDFIEEVEKAMHETFDGGWRYCEQCGEGFTLWYETIPLREIDKTEPSNGYHEETDMTLCDECWKEKEKCSES
jgi:hypothetical protein